NANLRPVRILPELQELSPLKSEIIQKGVDLVIVRELLGDCYFGEHKEYRVEEISNVAHTAFRLARTRSKKLTSVDKANVLTASRLWRTVVKEVAQEY